MVLTAKPELMGVREEGSGATVLSMAAQRGDLQLVKWIVNKAPYLLMVRDHDGDTALHEAVLNGHGTVLNEHGAIAQYLIAQEPELLTIKGKNGETVLHAAMRYGDSERIVFLLERASSGLLAEVDDRGNTLLHIAAGNCIVGIWSILLSAEISESLFAIKNQAGDTILHCAARNKNVEVLATLVKRFPTLGVEKNAREENVLQQAVREGNLAVVQVLGELAPMLLGSVDAAANLPLHKAIQGNADIEMIRLLVNTMRNANISLRVVNAEGNTALHLAAQQGSRKIIEFLITQASPGLLERQNNNGDTFLHLVTQANDVELVEYFSRIFPILSTKQNNRGETVLTWLLERYQTILDIQRERTPLRPSVGVGGLNHSVMPLSHSQVPVFRTPKYMELITQPAAEVVQPTGLRHELASTYRRAGYSGAGLPLVLPMEPSNASSEFVSYADMLDKLSKPIDWGGYSGQSTVSSNSAEVVQSSDFMPEDVSTHGTGGYSGLGRPVVFPMEPANTGSDFSSHSDLSAISRPITWGYHSGQSSVGSNAAEAIQPLGALNSSGNTHSMGENFEVNSPLYTPAVFGSPYPSSEVSRPGYPVPVVPTATVAPFLDSVAAPGLASIDAATAGTTMYRGNIPSSR